MRLHYSVFNIIMSCFLCFALFTSTARAGLLILASAGHYEHNYKHDDHCASYHITNTVSSVVLSLSLIGGGAAITILSANGVMSLGFLGLGIPMMVFDENKTDLTSELRFLTPSDLATIRQMVLARADLKSNQEQTILLPEHDVLEILERSNYSDKEIAKAIAVLSR